MDMSRTSAGFFGSTCCCSSRRSRRLQGGRTRGQEAGRGSAIAPFCVSGGAPGEQRPVAGPCGTARAYAAPRAPVSLLDGRIDTCKKRRRRCAPCARAYALQPGSPAGLAPGARTTEPSRGTHRLPPLMGDDGAYDIAKASVPMTRGQARAGAEKAPRGADYRGSAGLSPGRTSAKQASAAPCFGVPERRPYRDAARQCATPGARVFALPLSRVAAGVSPSARVCGRSYR